jgi:hypothetical protein
LVKLHQRRQARRWCADRYLAAHHRIEHPSGDGDDFPRSGFDEGDFMRPPAFSPVLDHLSADQRMPGVVDGDIPPDMRRITLRSA